MSDYFDRVRVRVAPSPTGPPHVGTAYIALFDYAFARHAGGDFILRIEDTDRERSTRQSEQDIVESLAWLGLQWQEGPDVGGPCGPYRQSERSDTYRQHAEQLLERGALYRCFCTAERLDNLRKTQRSSGAPVGYDRHCRSLTDAEIQEKLDAGAPYTLRLKAPEDGETSFQDLVRGTVTVNNRELEDLIMLKSDGFPTYHLANVVDDHLMKISHVVRAEEWISSTPVHVLLYQAFGWELPSFIHMPLLRNQDRSKISKRKNPTSILWYRERGYLPEALRNFLALMGWSLGDEQEFFTLDEMVAGFSWDRLKTSGPVFDMQKLEWMNAEYIRRLTPDELLQRILAEPYTRHLDEPRDRLLAICVLVQERMKLLSEFDELTGFFFEREPYDPADLIPKKKDGQFAQEALTAAFDALKAVPDWTAESLESALRELAEEKGCKRGQLYMPLRVATTCRRVSTPLFETMELLGRAECMERIEEAIRKASDLD